MNARRPDDVNTFDRNLSNFPDALDNGIRRFTSDLNRPGTAVPDFLMANGGPLPDLPDLRIDFNPRGGNAFDRAVPRGYEGLPQYTSTELAQTLGPLFDQIDRGEKGGKITANEIYAYLGRNDGRVDQDTEDKLRYMAEHIREIGGKDNNISKFDMCKFVAESPLRDQRIMMGRMEERLARLEEENRRLKEGSGDRKNPPGDVIKPGPERPPEARVNGISDISSPEQTAFRQKWGTPENMDLCEFGKGKPNDGVVPPMPNVGFGGIKDDGGRKWDDPNYNTGKYAVGRNMARLFQSGVLNNLSEEQQKECIQDFLALQKPVLEADGHTTGQIYKESIQVNGVWMDTIGSFGEPGAPKYENIQWIEK